MISACIVAIVVAMAIFGFPTFVGNGIACAENGDYDAFYDTYMEMIEDDSSNEAGLVRSASVDAEQGYNKTRIVVNSSNKINLMGAEKSCFYNNFYFLQYSSPEKAEIAYNYYTNSDLSVFYDFDLSVNDYEVENIETNSLFNTASTYNSWGWKSSADYLGAKSYLTSLNALGEEFQDVVVAVVDSGIRTTHTLLKDRYLEEGRDYTGKGSYEDDCGHGTHVSGTIAEITPSSVKILPLKVLNSKGVGNVSSMIAALNYIYSLRNQFNIKVVNMSLGITSSSVPKESVAAFSSAFEGLVNNLYNSNIVSIVSAGNEKQDATKVQPANFANAFTVSALSYTSSALLSTTKLIFAGSYSNYGSVVDFCAPGTSIKSSYYLGDNSYAELSGTSMAAPHVSACVALYYSQESHSSTSIAELYSLLKNNANTACLSATGAYALNGAKRNDYYGYGCVNIAGLSVQIDGNVVYDTDERYFDSETIVTLSYSGSVGDSQSYRIFYTDDESVDIANLNTANMSYKANSSISLKVLGSAKITSVVYVYSGSSVIKRSEVSVETFYINNYDIESNYQISNGIITKYNGTALTTLNVPKTIGGEAIVAIGSSAFADAKNIEILNLPSTIETIYENAFYSSSKTNTSLKEVNFGGDGIVIGNNAFRSCTNLNKVNISNITEIGTFAFSSTAVSELNLEKIKTIGANAFTYSSLKKVIFGKNLTSIGSQRLTMNGVVYGYAGTVAQTFANNYSADFYDLTLNVEDDFNSQKYIKYGRTLTLSVTVNGYGVTYSGATGTASSKSVVNLSSTSGYINTYRVTLSGLSEGSYRLSLSFKDFYGSTKSTNEISIRVLPSSTNEYSLNYDDNCVVYVDGDEVEKGYILYDGVSYNIKVIANDGYILQDIKINDSAVKENEGCDFEVTSPVVVSCTSIEKKEFDIYFESEHGKISVDGTELADNYYSVSKNEDLKFFVENELGYEIIRVSVDGKLLVANADGSYTVQSISDDKLIEIEFSKAYYAIEVTYVNSCGMLYSPDLDNVAFGTKDLAIKVLPNNGYSIDFVTVNGKNVKVVGGQFVIDYVDGNMDVVVAFKESNSLFSGENSIIIYYFLVFAGLFVAFIIGRIVLNVVRKRKNA